MKTIVKHIITTTILLLSFKSFTYSQNVNFTAVAPSTVSEGQSFKVTFSINAKGVNFVAPSFKGFNVLSGPNQSTSTSIQIINGVANQSVEYAYTYILQAIKEGTYNIPGATIVVDGNTYTSNSLTIKVIKGTPPQAHTQQPYYQPNYQNYQQLPQIGNEDIFIKTIPSKTTVYQGEPLVVTQKIYTKLNLVGFENTKFPTYDGFWTEEVKMPEQITLTNENYNGTIYKVAELKKTILFPQKTGKITIDPSEIECIVRVSRRSNNFWDNFFGSNIQDIKHKIKNNPIVINVLPLPEQGKPDDFSGLVGNFKIEATISKTKAKTNDAIDLKVVVSGNGNLRLVEKFNFDFPPDIEVYDPKITDNISVTANGVSGSRTFEYLLIPRNAGVFTIKPVTFSFFNISKKQYETLSTPLWTLEIEKGAGTSYSVTTSVKREDLKYIGSDIRFIKSGNLNLKRKDDIFFLSKKYYTIMSSIPLAFIVLFFVLRKKIKENSNIALVRNKRATKIARKRLKRAEEMLKAKNYASFYEEISKAIYGYVCDKLNIELSELSVENLKTHLAKTSVEQELIEKYVSLLNDCEFARFAPSAITEFTPESIYKRATEIITQLENTYKLEKSQKV